VLLYELLTGTTPFERERMERSSSWEVQRIIRDEEAPRPSARLNALSRSGLPSRTAGPKDIPSPRAPTRNTGPTTLADVAQRRETTARVLHRSVRAEIDSIALKALQKHPSERYATAQDLADDLQRFLHGEPIHAKPPGTVAIVSKWVRRRPALASLIAVSVLAVAGVAIEQSLHAVALKDLNTDLRKSNTELSQSLLDEQAATTRAEQNERESREVVYASDIHNAWRARAEGDFVEFESIVQKYRDNGPLAQYRGLEWHFLQRLTRTEGRELLRLPEAVYATAFSPNGRWLAVAGQDGVIREIEFSTGRIAEQWNSGQTENNAVHYSPGATGLWSSGDDGTLREWRVDTHAALQAHAAHAEGAYDIVYYCPPQPEDWRMVSCGREPVIRLWGPNGEPREILEGHTDWVEDLELHPDGRRLVSVSQDGTARVWDLDEKRLLRILSPQSGKVRHAAISPDGRILATCSDRVRLWDLDNWDRLATLDFVDRPQRVCFAFPDAQLCVADNVGMLHLFHLRFDDPDSVVKPEPGLSWRGHADSPYVLMRSPGGGELISAGKDGRVVVWSSSGLTSTETRNVDCHRVNGCVFDPERGQLLWAGGSRVYGYDCELPATQPIRFPSNENQQLRSVAISPAGGLLAAATDSRDLVQTWRLVDRSPLVTIDLLDGVERDEYTGVTTLSFSQDGRTLAALAEGTLFLHDPRTGQVQQRIDMGQGRWAVFSPTEPDVLVLQSHTHTIRALHWSSGEGLWETPELPQRPWCVVFTPDGQQVLSSGEERTVRVWDAHTGSLVRELRGHRAFVEHIDVTPDGRTIASIDRDGILRFWHRMTGQFLCEMSPSRDGGIGRFCVFSPDGRWLAVRSRRDTVQLLPLKQ
jgi:WD40 repeat protein